MKYIFINAYCRTNSSILGQRKKNQRKTRNKRRCQERRASESENSEGGEKEWERERRTDDEKEKSEIVFEDKLSTSSNSGDPSPTFQESRDLNEAEDDTSKPFNAGCPSEQSPNKGKRNNQKGAVALDASIPGVPQEEFGSDMIFDLDM
jgi:dynein assembly factor 2